MKLSLKTAQKIFALVAGLSFNAHAYTLIDQWTIGNVEFKIIEERSSSSMLPSLTITAPENYKILGGGAEIIFNGGGVLLTSAYPGSNGYADYSAKTFTFQGKAHSVPDLGYIVGRVIIARKRDGSELGLEDIRVVVGPESPASNIPVASATLPDGFTLTGGGAHVIGSPTKLILLTESIPSGNGWRAAGKAHFISDPGRLSAFAIGVRNSLLSSEQLEIRQFPGAESSASDWSSGGCRVSAGYRLLSGGARTNWNHPGNLLYASFPINSTGWEARGKAHQESSPATISTVCIGIK